MLLVGSNLVFVTLLTMGCHQSNQGIVLVVREYNSDFDLEQWFPTQGAVLSPLWLQRQ